MELFRGICRNLYWLSYFEYVYEKENFSEVLAFAKKHKFKIDDQYRPHLEAQVDRSSGPKLPPGLPQKKEAVPRFAFSRLTMLETRKLVEENSSSHILKPINLKRFAEHLLKLESSHPNDVRELILSIVRNGLYRSEDIAGLITIKDYFENKGRKETAAFVSMLCFVYARGGGGWYALADSKFNYLAKDALRLSKKTAEEILASELSYLFSKATYFMGPTRHLIEFLPGNGQLKLAEKIWEEAYEVIRHRLPIPKELETLLAKEAPKFKYSQRPSVETLIKELIIARKKIVIS